METETMEDDVMQTPIVEVFHWLTEKQAEKMDELGVKTARDFERLRAGLDADYPRGLSSVSGWGAVAVTKFENGMLDWLAKNQHVEEAPEEGAGIVDAVTFVIPGVAAPGGSKSGFPIEGKDGKIR